jgi:small subunit ribosomal protein S5
MKVKSGSGEQLNEVLVNVNRVTKVTKGGSRFSFSACIIVGDKNGRVGYGHGKAKEVTGARAKAVIKAKNNLTRVLLHQGRTIHHDVIGKSGAGKVILKKAKPGTGLIAGGAMRAIFDSLGVHDIVAKSLGSNNVYAMIAATFDALLKLSSPKMLALKRGKQLSELSTKFTKEPINLLDRSASTGNLDETGDV